MHQILRYIFTPLAVLLITPTAAARVTWGGGSNFSTPATVTGPAVFFVGDALQLVDTPNGFEVQGFLDVHTNGAGNYQINWVVERPITDPASPGWQNFAKISGQMAIPFGGTVASLVNKTDHFPPSFLVEGLVTATANNGGAGYGAGLGVLFNSGTVASPLFNHGGLDDLRQRVTIDFTAPAGFQVWLFEFPGSVVSTTIPAPGVLPLLALAGIVAKRRRRR